MRLLPKDNVCHSFHITLFTQVTCHSARWVLGLRNSPNYPIRRNIYCFMAKPDSHWQRSIMSPGKKNEYLNNKKRNLPQEVRTFPIATVFTCDFEYLDLRSPRDSRVANYKALNIEEKCWCIWNCKNWQWSN